MSEGVEGALKGKKGEKFRMRGKVKLDTYAYTCDTINLQLYIFTLLCLCYIQHIHKKGRKERKLMKNCKTKRERNKSLNKRPSKCDLIQGDGCFS